MFTVPVGDKFTHNLPFFSIQVYWNGIRQKLLDDYYDERGWDIETGIPTEETLMESDLQDVFRDLQDRGFIK